MILETKVETLINRSWIECSGTIGSVSTFFPADRNNRQPHHAINNGNSGSGALSGRVQLLAQHLTQRVDRHGRIIRQQCSVQGLVDQGLITLAQRFAAFLETCNHLVIQIDRNPCLALLRNYRAAFGMSHVVISFHNFFFLSRWQTEPKSNGYNLHAEPSTLLKDGPMHPHQLLQTSPRLMHRGLRGSAQKRHKTPAQLPQRKHHASGNWQPPFWDQTQSPCVHDTYKICISQADNRRIAASIEAIRTWELPYEG